MTYLEKTGLWSGKAAGSIFRALSRLRGVPSFHPGGDVFEATVQMADSENDRRTKIDLRGSALVRLSTSLWRKETLLPDILGCAIRFGWDSEDGDKVYPKHQDLLFITAHSTLFLGTAVIFTRSKSFFKDNFFAIAKFRIEGRERVLFRLVPFKVRARGNNRWERLENAVADGEAGFHLEWRSPGPLKSWEPLAEIRLRKRVMVHGHHLHFSPFHTGLKIHPAGWLNYTRRFAYRASQAGHPFPRY